MLDSSKLDKKQWDNFIKNEGLSSEQADQFQYYLHMLLDWNQRMNLTTITDPANIITYHFQDSLYVYNYVDFNNVNAVCDIGAGAGFPGLPLKIKYPHISLILIEVNQKKIGFLEAVIRKLELEAVEISPLDWRTFLRKTDYYIDLFFARASLQPDELIRMFKPTSPYNKSTLVYWASNKWQATEKEVRFVDFEKNYSIGSKKRKLIFFKLK